MIYNHYSLKASQPFSLCNREEKHILIDLEPIKDVETCLMGLVIDQRGQAVTNAVVTLFDSNYSIVCSVETDINGLYVFADICKNKFSFIAAIAKGYTLSDFKQISFEENCWVRYDFELKENTIDQKSILYGQIFEKNRQTFLNEVDVLLESKDINNYFWRTSSNEDGEYLIENLDGGNYFLSVIKQGYKKIVKYPIIIASKEYKRINITLKPIINKGIINGFVTNSKDASFRGDKLPVFLFRLTEGGEKLLSTQLTQHEGFFLFLNISPGRYIVKVKLPNEKLYKEYFEL